MATRRTYIIAAAALLLLCVTIYTVWRYVKMRRDEETRQIAARKAAERARRQREYLMQRYRHDILHKARMAQSIRNPPIIRKLSSIFQEFENDTDAWHLLLEAGEIYMRGDFPTYLPNTQLAQDIFRVALTCPRGAVSGIAQSRYIESRVSRMDASDMAGAALPDTYGQRMIHIATHRIRNVPPSAFETPVPMYTPEQRPARITHEPVVVPIDIPVERIVHNDLQNVHDHSVVHATRHILENIEKNDQNDRNSRPEIESALLDSALNDDDKIRALAVLDSLNVNTHSSFKMTETEALNAVWSKIQSMDTSMKSNVTETLLHQLASGVENGHIVCSTGKIARFVGALDGLGNNEVKLRPMWAVRDELGTMASKKRGSDNHSEDRSRELRREFVDEATALYCKDLGLNPLIMDPLISLYADAI